MPRRTDRSSVQREPRPRRARSDRAECRVGAPFEAGGVRAQLLARFAAYTFAIAHNMRTTVLNFRGRARPWWAWVISAGSGPRSPDAASRSVV